jgi:hypothetical protein
MATRGESFTPLELACEAYGVTHKLGMAGIRVIIIGSFAAFMNFSNFPPATKLRLNNLDLFITSLPQKNEIKECLKE